MVPTSLVSNGESKILGSTQNPTDLTVYMILGLRGIATFTLDFVMYEGMELVINQENQALYDLNIYGMGYWNILS